jgi:hypothetical protein
LSEFDDVLAEPRGEDLGTPTLRIRAQRDGSFAVEHEGMPLPVEEIDIDEATLERLNEQPRTVRG